MLIKELYLQRYGPVRERSCTLGPGFNLLSGSNEDGKTLTIDALVKLLLGGGRELKDFDAIKRVDENPEGYLILETPGGDTYKVPEQGALQDLTGLSAADCRNIFIIRDSKLSLANEGDFYTRVTDRLTGLRTAEIGDIRSKLCDMAAITPTGQFRNVGEDKLRERLDGAERIAGAAGTLHEKLIAEGYDELESEQVACTEECAAIDHRLEALEAARRREQYEKYAHVLDELQKARDAASAAQSFTEADERLWTDAARDMHRLEQERERLQTGLQDKEKALRELEKELQEQQRGFQQIAGRKKIIDDEIRPGLKIYADQKEELTRQESKGRLYTIAVAGGAVVLALSLLGFLLSPAPLFYITAALSGLVAAGGWLSLYRLARDRGALAVTLDKIKALLASHGLDGETEADLHRVVQALADEHDTKQVAFNRLQGETEILAREIKTLREEDIPARERELDGNAAEIDRIKRKAGQETLEQYTACLAERQQAEQAAAQQTSALESVFGAPGATAEENTAAWADKVEELAAYREAAVDLRYSQKEVDTLKGRKRALEEQQRSAAERMDHFARELQEIERQANHALQCRDDYLHCQTTGDLAEVRERLLEFVRRHRENRGDAMAVISIFEAIENEERARVAELFGSDSPVTRHFRDFTGGLYEAVLYDRDQGAIRVRRRDGADLSAGQLSGGAYDQLYLSIRLALAEKLLPDERGFFIMDDPLIKSDTARLQRQLQTLLQVAAEGWQIIYFSAKDEVREALQPEVNAGAVTHLPLQSIFET